jgi:hypothetical protein
MEPIDRRKDFNIPVEIILRVPPHAIYEAEVIVPVKAETEDQAKEIARAEIEGYVAVDCAIRPRRSG